MSLTHRWHTTLPAYPPQASKPTDAIITAVTRRSRSTQRETSTPAGETKKYKERKGEATTIDQESRKDAGSPENASKCKYK
jgi:hypothetical protein